MQKLDDEVEVFFFDEGRLGTKSSTTRLWAKKGATLKVKVRQGYENFYCYSSVAPKSGDISSLILPEVNTEMFQIYLDHFSLERADKKILLIMDQAGWHKSKSLLVPSNITILYLPAYSPELNPVERLWKDLKQNCVHNRLSDSIDQLVETVISYYQNLNENKLMRLCSCSYI